MEKQIIVNNVTDKPHLLKLELPTYALRWREKIKTIPGRIWSASTKSWIVSDTREMRLLLGLLFDDKQLVFDDVKEEEVSKYTYKGRLTEGVLRILINYEYQLRVNKKPPKVIAMYKNTLRKFLLHFREVLPGVLKKQHLDAYLSYRIEADKISEKTQNVIRKAIEFYFEHLLDAVAWDYNRKLFKETKTKEDNKPAVEAS